MARRFKLATALNLAGLVIALAAFYLFMTQVIYNRNYNRGISDYERIYRLETSGVMDGEWSSLSSRFNGETTRHLSQVETVSLLELRGYFQETFLKGTTEMAFAVMRSNNEGLTLFSPKMLDGKCSWTDEDREGYVIPASVAQKYFGKTQVAGQTMRKTNGKEVVVRGVYEDFPDNCSMKNRIIVNMKDVDKYNLGNYNYTCFVKLNPNCDTLNLASQLRDVMKKDLLQLLADNGQSEQSDEVDDFFSGTKFRFVPIKDTYFSKVDKLHDRGNAGMMLVLQISCLLVLLVATINFLNFTLAESPMRIRGINTRLVLGSKRRSLRMSLIGENVLVALLACVIALGVCYLFSKYSGAKELVDGSVALADHKVLVAILFVIAIAIGIVSAVYPARYATSFPPAMVLKGSFGLSPNGRKLRKVLVGLQLVIALMMVTYIGILFMQSRYIYSSDYGFEKDEVLYAKIKTEKADKREVIKQQIKQLPGVQNAAYSAALLGTQDEYMTWGRGDDEHKVNFTCLIVDCDYMKTMGIKITEGRDFTDHDRSGSVYIINEAARKQWDWVQIGRSIFSQDSATVVGVCENIRFASVRVDNASAPLVFWLRKTDRNDWDQLYVLNVRVGSGVDKLKVRQQINDLLKQNDNAASDEVKFLDNQLEKTYKEEFNFIRQVLVFSIICLLITLIGVFCLTMFETEYRRKEIGIRKVFGSTTGEILKMLCRQYAWIIALSFVVAAPLAWYFGRKWLENFAERTPVHWWLFALSLLIVAVITLGTVILQSWKTANENPIHSVKTE